MKTNFSQKIMLFSVGGLGYGLLEILWRGSTHWSMLLTGGGCLLLLDRLDLRHRQEWLVVRCIRGSLLITAVELLVGLLVNRLLRLNVWDYSAQRYNLAGQICPVYSLLWYLLCYPVFGMLHKLRKGRE
jgi:uncharacterized membrane protein